MLICLHRQCKKKYTKGVTLLELILVMVLLGIAAVMVTPFVGNVFTNLIEGRQLSHIENQAFQALERFVRDVRGAITVDESEFPGKMTLDDGDLVYDINGGVLYLNDKILVKNLAVDAADGTDKSEIGRNSTLTDFSFFTLKLVLKINENKEFELSASAVQRNSL
jgi:prepilin-type N-terminal cleavage/methylation domain-containing protein